MYVSMVVPKFMAHQSSTEYQPLPLWFSLAEAARQRNQCPPHTRIGYHLQTDICTCTIVWLWTILICQGSVSSFYLHQRIAPRRVKQDYKRDMLGSESPLCRCSVMTARRRHMGLKTNNPLTAENSLLLTAKVVCDGHKCLIIIWWTDDRWRRRQ